MLLCQLSLVQTFGFSKFYIFYPTNLGRFAKANVNHPRQNETPPMGVIFPKERSSVCTIVYNDPNRILVKKCDFNQKTTQDRQGKILLQYLNGEILQKRLKLNQMNE
jgi:hypothetical protein